MYNIKYQTQFYDANEKLIKLDISQLNYSGTIFPLLLAANPIELDWKLSSSGLFMYSQAKINIIVNDKLAGFREIVENERDFFVEIYRDNKLIFSGYIVPDQYQEQLIDVPYDLTIRATDGIGYLQNEPFSNSVNADSEPLPREGLNTAFEILRFALNKLGTAAQYDIAECGVTYEENMNTGSPLNQFKLDMGNYVEIERINNVDIKHPSDCYYVIEEVLKLYVNATLTKTYIPEFDKYLWAIIPMNAKVQDIVEFRRFAFGGTALSETLNVNTLRNIENVNGRIPVICEPNTATYFNYNRAGVATVLNQSGKLVDYDADEIPIRYNRIGNIRQGFLYEAQRTNQIPFSIDFEQFTGKQNGLTAKSPAIGKHKETVINDGGTYLDCTANGSTLVHRLLSKANIENKLIPQGYKAGTLYGMNGLDFDVERASVKTRQSKGQIKLVNSNEVAIDCDFITGEYKGINIEENRTELGGDVYLSNAIGTYSRVVDDFPIDTGEYLDVPATIDLPNNANFFADTNYYLTFLVKGDVSISVKDNIKTETTNYNTTDWEIVRITFKTDENATQFEDIVISGSNFEITGFNILLKPNSSLILNDTGSNLVVDRDIVSLEVVEDEMYYVTERNDTNLFLRYIPFPNYELPNGQWDIIGITENKPTSQELEILADGRNVVDLTPYFGIEINAEGESFDFDYSSGTYNVDLYSYGKLVDTFDNVYLTNLIDLPNIGNYFIVAKHGTLRRFLFQSSINKNEIQGCLGFGDVNWSSSIVGIMNQTGSLKYLSGIINKGVDIVKISFAFSQSNLTKVRKNLLENTPNVEEANAVFQSTNLTSIDKDFLQYTPLVTSLDRFLWNTNLTSIDKDFLQYTPLVTNLERLLYGTNINTLNPLFFQYTANCLNYAGILGFTSIPVNDLSGIYIVLANTNTNVEIPWGAGNNKYDPNYTNTALDPTMTAGQARNILLARNWAIVDGGSI